VELKASRFAGAMKEAFLSVGTHVDRTRMIEFYKFLAVISALTLFGCQQNPISASQTTSDTLITHERVLADGQQPAVSPDGRKIAYTNNGDVYSMDTSGTGITQLTNGPEFDFAPRWRPDGLSVGFVRTDSGTSNLGLLYEVSAAGGSVIPLVAGQTVEDRGRWDWSPDGKYIALLSYNSSTEIESLKVVTLANNKTILAVETYNGYGLGSGEGSAWLVNLTVGVVAKDSVYRTASDLCRSASRDAFAYSSHRVASTQIELTDFTNRLGEHNVSSAFGLRWSPDEKSFLYSLTYFDRGPFPYHMSQIAIYSLERHKEYLLINKGDVFPITSNGFNISFQWGLANNTVYFERYRQINVVTFQLPK